MPQLVPPECELKTPDVNLEGVHPKLIDFLTVMGPLHRLLFGAPLVITSAKDGAHSATGLHPQGRAVDLRTHDLAAQDALLFVHLVAHAALTLPLGYFWEVRQPGGAHLHVEWHGE